jgi:hypothetical protein
VFALVPALQLELPGFGRNDGGTGTEGGSQHDRAVGVGLRARILKAAQRTLAGYETMNMIRKGQLKGAEKGDILAQVKLINRLFGIAA